MTWGGLCKIGALIGAVLFSVAAYRVLQVFVAAPLIEMLLRLRPGHIAALVFLTAGLFILAGGMALRGRAWSRFDEIDAPRLMQAADLVMLIGGFGVAAGLGALVSIEVGA